MKHAFNIIGFSLIGISLWIFTHESEKNYPTTPKEIVKDIKESSFDLYHYVVEVTMYNPVESQCGVDYLTTASGKKINPQMASTYNWIAVSRDLLKRNGGIFRWGDKVKVTGADHKDGIYYVYDTMHPKWKNRIDILETEGTKQYKFKNVKLRKL